MLFDIRPDQCSVVERSEEVRFCIWMRCGICFADVPVNIRLVSGHCHVEIGTLSHVHSSSQGLNFRAIRFLEHWFGFLGGPGMHVGDLRQKKKFKHHFVRHIRAVNASGQDGKVSHALIMPLFNSASHGDLGLMILIWYVLHSHSFEKGAKISRLAKALSLPVTGDNHFQACKGISTEDYHFKKK